MAVRGKRPWVRLRIPGTTKKRLAQLRRQSRALAPVLRIIQLDLIRSVQRNFIAEGRRDDATGLWPALSEATIARRRTGQRGGGPGRQVRPLRDTSNLFDSIQKPEGNRIGPNFVEVGTNVEYAAKHQQKGRWGTKMLVRETRRVPAHTRTQKVRNKRGKLVDKKVQVREHTQKLSFQLPARPFLWIHASDKKRAAKRVTQWIARSKRGDRGNGNTRGGARGS